MKRLSVKVTGLVLFLIIVSVSSVIHIPSVSAVDWSPEMQITWNTRDDGHPSAAQAKDGRIWFVWHSDRSAGDYEIYYKIYNSTATNPWSPEMQLTNTPGFDISPSIMHAADNRTWVAWTKRPTLYGIYYKIYDGTSWTSEMNLTNAVLDDTSPVLLQTANGTIWAFWASRKTGNSEIYLKTSSDNGLSWSSERQVTYTTNQNERDPSVTQSADGKIWLVFTSGYPEDVFYTTSFDGVTWSPVGSIGSSSAIDWHPSIAQAADGKMWAIWDSDRTPGPYGADQNDLFYSVYSGSWSAAQPFVTDVEEEDNMPFVLRTSDGALWVTWSATRNSLLDIYYKTTSLPQPHDVAVFYVSPLKNMVGLGHTVSIEIVAQNHGANTETFSINLYANTTLIGSRLIVGLVPGDLYPVILDWDTSGFALGSYDIMANATVVVGETDTADNTYVDGKVTVVVHDLAILSVTPGATIAYLSYYRSISVDVRNEGTVTEDATVSAYCNTTMLGVQTVYSLEPGITVRLWFYVFDVPYGNYTVSAEVTPVLDEDHQADNYGEGGHVFVTIPGDVNGDKTVDILDVSGVSAHWYPGPPEGPLSYNLFFDVNEDGAVDILEVGILSSHWGEAW